MLIAENDFAVISESHLFNGTKLILEAHVAKGENIEKCKKQNYSWTRFLFIILKV